MDNIFRSKGFVLVENIYIFLKKKQVDAKSEFYRTNMCKNIYFSNGTESNTLVESLAWELGYYPRITFSFGYCIWTWIYHQNYIGYHILKKPDCTGATLDFTRLTLRSGSICNITHIRLPQVVYNITTGSIYNITTDSITTGSIFDITHIWYHHNYRHQRIYFS